AGGTARTPPAAGPRVEQRARLRRADAYPDGGGTPRPETPRRRGNRSRHPARRQPRLPLPGARGPPEQLPLLRARQDARRPDRQPREAGLDPEPAPLPAVPAALHGGLPPGPGSGWADPVRPRAVPRSSRPRSRRGPGARSAPASAARRTGSRARR